MKKSLDESFDGEPPSEEPPSYFNVTKKEWDDPQWQIQNSITTKDGIEKHLKLTEDESKFFDNGEKLQFRITPYYFNLIKGKGSEYPLRKTVIPNCKEFIRSIIVFVTIFDLNQFRK